MTGYDDGYGQGRGGWEKILRLLDKSFRLGRAFGVEIRLHWTIVVVPIFLSGVLLGSGTPSATAWGIALLTTVGLYAVIYSHEMGHVLGGRRYGIFTPLITLSPLGGLAHMAAPAPNPKAEIVVALAGPAVHLVWLAVCWPASFLIPDSAPYVWRSLAAWLVGINVALLLFNLLPFLPMDGGRVFRALLSRRMHANRATLIAARVGMGGAVAFVIAGLFGLEGFGFLLLLIGISNFLSCRQELMVARHGEVYSGHTREPWESDPDAWKRGSASTADEPAQRRPGPVSRMKAKRRAAREARERESDAELERELDRALARVKEVGMAGLTREERAVLERASRRRPK